jgi:hypothetical protein
MKKIIFTLFILFFTLKTNATIVHVANDVRNYTNNGSSVVLNVSPTTLNNLMIVSLSWCCSTGVPTVSDDKSHTWTLVGTSPGGSYGHISIYYAFSTTAGVGTVTVAAGGETQISASFSEYSGVQNSPPITDGYVTSTTSTSNANSGSLTPTVSGDLLYCAGTNIDTSQAGSMSASYTNVVNYTNSASVLGLDAGYQVYASTASKNCTISWGTVFNSPIALVAFKPISSAKIFHKATTD